MSVHIYVEGGGPHDRTQTQCRRGFRELIEKVIGTGSMPRIVACGGRRQAYDDFKLALTRHPNDLVILLVDSEDPVVAQLPWQHLRTRDNWSKPRSATDEQVHLMVQCVETWILADRNALIRYYPGCLHENALPVQADLEDVSRHDAYNALCHATRDCQKGQYHKTRHGFALLGELDPAAVRSKCKWADRFFTYLEQACAP